MRIPAHPVDTLEALELLRSFDIRVDRCAYVETANAAVAFAKRRPVLLRTPERASAQPAAEELGDSDAIRRAFRRLGGGTVGRLLIRVVPPPGIDVAIRGEHDTIVLRCGAHETRRRCPLGPFEADGMLTAVASEFGIARSAQARGMLTHLLVKVSEMYERSGIDAFTLDPVRLHEHGYTVCDATIVASHELHAPVGVSRRSSRPSASGRRPAGARRPSP